MQKAGHNTMIDATSIQTKATFRTFVYELKIIHVLVFRQKNV